MLMLIVSYKHKKRRKNKNDMTKITITYIPASTKLEPTVVTRSTHKHELLSDTPRDKPT